MNAAETVGGPSTEEDALACTTTASCPTRSGCETTHQKNSSSRHSPTKHRLTAHILSGEPTRPHQRPVGSRLHLTRLCPGRPCTPPIGPGSPGYCHRDHPRSLHSIPVEAEDKSSNPAPRDPTPDAWLAISPARAGCSQPCALQTRVAVARTLSVRPRHRQHSGPPLAATPPPDRARVSLVLVRCVHRASYRSSTRCSD